MTDRQRWFDRNGQPLDASTANDLLGDRAYQRVALTRITSATDTSADFMVSTVWLGLNYNWDDGPPLLFETMVFGGDDRQEETCYRWTTEQAAHDGHAEVVATVAATVLDDRVADLPDWPVSLVKRNR